MPIQLVRKRSKAQGGDKTVQYRDTRGRTFDAVITGPGTGNTVNLVLIDRNRKSKVAGQGAVFTNVPLATALRGAGSTGVYFNRLV